MLSSFAKYILANGGEIKPIILPISELPDPAIMNPSIINVKDKLLINIRNTNYALYHAERSVNEHIWGPLTYLHPENHMALVTTNILCELDDSLNIVNHNIIDTKQLDQQPIWHFIGLEDVRLSFWNEELFICGVRRDTTDNGQGRMELSKIDFSTDYAKEVSRDRIPAPGDNASYCEKNWMPILDMPYHFIKWSNPTEVVKFDPAQKTTSIVALTEFKVFENCGDIRGGSQVIRFENYYMALAHEVSLYSSEAGRKDGEYYHRFVIWDDAFNIVNISDRINFLGAKIEFSCGMCLYKDFVLVTFSFQDNASFVMKIPKNIVKKLVSI